MEINYRLLGEQMAAAGLAGKPVNEYSKEDVQELVRAVLLACPRRPFVEELRSVFLEKGVDSETFYRFFNASDPPF